MKRIFIALSLLFALTQQISAQDDSAKLPKQASDTVKLPYKHKVKYAEKQLDAGNYFDAQDLYKGLNVKKPSDLKVLYMLAESYRLSRDYKAAEAGYKLTIDNGQDKYPDAWYYYGLMLQMNGKYAEAKTALDKYIADKAGAGNKELLKYAKLQSDAAAWALTATQATYKVEHLSPPVNRNKTDYAPRVSGNTLYFSSINNDSLLNTGVWVPGQMQSHTYTASLVNDEWSNVQLLPQPLNGAGKHTGNTAITNDGKRMYLTICAAEAENKITCKIYVSTIDDNGVWSKPKVLGKTVNAEGSDNTHPAVAKTENGVDVLYFASNRSGGKGGYDIYKVDVKHTGSAGSVINLDATVNTEWDEITPYFYERKNVLFFSSNGRIGFGGYDNYSASLGEDGKFLEAENLGSPLNSPADDMGYAAGEDKKNFYFVSNRVGIIGDKSETCCDDIFKGINTFVPTLAVSGKIMERVDSTEQNPLTGARVEIYDVTDGIPKLVYADSTSGADFFYPLDVDKKYSLKFSKKDHFTAHHTISTMDLEANDTMSYTATLDKIIVNKTYKLSKIFYEYNSAKLTAESEATLDTLYALLTENPELTIELSAHTDSIGSASYNMDLSQKRAQSCAEYLVAKGLDDNRINPVGYGFTQPVAPNSINKKDNPEGRALNRRTEFKVLDGKLKQKGDKLILD